MKIKSLLLGSAAALVAVTGARAADAVIVEPEPVEYVRVCDAYGVGFFYIPGTETCLRLSGELRYQINVSDADLDPSRPGDQRGWTKSARARLNIDARSDTEWGTLRGFMRLQADWNAANNFVAIRGPGGPTTYRLATTDGPVYVDHAYIEIGGLRVGYTESAFVTTQYGGKTGFGGFSDTGLSYGYQQRNLMSYSYQFGTGGFATLSLEDDGNSNYMPDIVGSVGISQGWGAVWVNVGYDEDIAPGLTFVGPGPLAPNPIGISGTDGFGVKAGLHLDVPNMPGSAFRLIGFYSNNANAYSVGSRWSILASYQHQLTSTLSGTVGFQYFGDTNFGTAGNPSMWAADAALSWTPVTNFNVRLEGQYSRTNPLAGPSTDSMSGFLRFTRSF